MNKQKEIEEISYGDVSDLCEELMKLAPMQKTIDDLELEIYRKHPSNSLKSYIMRICYSFLLLNYRKIDKNSVVLTMKEYERLKKQDLFMKDYTIMEVLEKETKKTSKKTVEKILKEIEEFLIINSIPEMDSDDEFIITASLDECIGKLNEIATREGVEIKE